MNEELPVRVPSITVLLTERQKLVYESLVSRSLPSIAEYYLGILYAVANRANPERLVQAAHSARELVNWLPRILQVPQADRSETESKLTELATQRGKFESMSKAALIAKIDELITLHALPKDRHANKISDIIKKVDAAGGLPEPERQKIAQLWVKRHGWFNRVSKHGTCSEQEFLAVLSSLENDLLYLFAPYFTVERELNELVAKPDPVTADMERVNHLLVRKSHYDHFFSALSNPSWFHLLRKADFFKHPLPALREAGTISFPSWSVIKFLRHCAKDHSAEVAQVIVDSDDTDNSRVHQEFIELALLLRATDAKRVTPKAMSWIKEPYHHITLLPHALADLVVKLAEEGEIKAAFELASSIVDVQLERQKVPESEKDNELMRLASIRITGYASDWTYGVMLHKVVPALSVKDPVKSAKLLRAKLVKAIGLENAAAGVTSKDVDDLHVWRPAIEDHAQNAGHGNVKDLLIVHLRDLAIREAHEGMDSGKAVLAVLQEVSYPVFRRIEMYILTRYPHQYLSRIQQVLTTKEILLNSVLHREIFKLLEVAFEIISPKARESLLSLIDAGPDLEKYRERQKKEGGVDPSTEDLLKVKQHWQLQWLAAVSKYLAGKWKDYYDGLLRKMGPLEHPDFLSYSSSWEGPTSPLNKEQLAAMSPEEVIRYLLSWTPSGEHWAPSPEGLGRFVTDHVRQHASEYSHLISTVIAKGLRPTYVYHLLSGLEGGLKDKANLDWSRILSLCESVVAAGGLSEPENDADGFETGWNGVRMQIARFLEEGLTGPHYLIPFDRREEVWSVLQTLADDTEPTPEYEQEHSEEHFDPMFTALNTVRGVAARAIFTYMLWCDYHLTRSKSKEEVRHAIPVEVLPILERFVDPSLERTQTVRAVVGANLQNLCYLDAEWTKKRITLLLPPDEPRVQLRNAVLTGYFSSSQASGYVFKTLRPLFILGLEWVILRTEDHSGGQARMNFVSHLVAYYWWGFEPLRGEDSLVQQLFEKTGPSTRAYAINFVGRELEHLRPTHPSVAEIFGRLQALWDWRLSVIESSPKKEDFIEELKDFGWWFAHSRMQPRWMIHSLIRTLEASKGQLEWTQEVMQRLEEYIVEFPVESAKAVDKIVRGETEGWGIGYWQPHLRTILEKLRACSDQTARATALATINYLGELGHREFRDLA